VYTGNKVNLSIAENANETLMEVYSENGEWRLDGFEITRDEFVYECCPEFYPEVNFQLRLQRRALYYAMNIILPAVMLSVLVLMVFRLPPESGEKMSLGVTLLLSYSVFLLIVSENVPNTSQAVPVIGKDFLFV
jgi:nicotinic acetylcholine receptor